MLWTELTIEAADGRLEAVCDRLVALGCGAYVVEDETDFLSFLENNRQYWDFVDDELAESMRGASRVKLYFGDVNEAKAIAAEFPGEVCALRDVRDEDWENNWKQYYKPIKVGERLLICPDWDESAGDGRVVLKLDPGTMFGTGAHATTRLCLEAIERVIKGGERVLDLGCGSGILAIAALLLGAESATGVDVDPRGERVSKENAAKNGAADSYTALTGDVSELPLPPGFDAVFANIVADVIIGLAAKIPPLLKPGGVFITSGIIDARASETRAALETVFERVEERESENWHAFVCSGARD